VVGQRLDPSTLRVSRVLEHPVGVEGHPRTRRNGQSPRSEDLGLWCARGELNQRDFRLGWLIPASLSVNPRSRCLPLDTVSRWACYRAAPAALAAATDMTFVPCDARGAVLTLNEARRSGFKVATKTGSRDMFYSSLKKQVDPYPIGGEVGRT
jgi:hypothetical protein